MQRSVSSCCRNKSFQRKIKCSFNSNFYLIMFQRCCLLFVWTLNYKTLKDMFFSISDTFKNIADPCSSNPGRQIYFPHPSDTTKYIRCDVFGRMFITQCPPRESWNQATTRCIIEQVRNYMCQYFKSAYDGEYCLLLLDHLYSWMRIILAVLDNLWDALTILY